MATVNKSITATYCVFKRTSFLAGILFRCMGVAE